MVTVIGKNFTLAGTNLSRKLNQMDKQPYGPMMNSQTDKGNTILPDNIRFVAGHYHKKACMVPLEGWVTC